MASYSDEYQGPGERLLEAAHAVIEGGMVLVSKDPIESHHATSVVVPIDLINALGRAVLAVNDRINQKEIA